MSMLYKCFMSTILYIYYKNQQQYNNKNCAAIFIGQHVIILYLYRRISSEIFVYYIHIAIS